GRVGRPHDQQAETHVAGPDPRPSRPADHGVGPSRWGGVGVPV
ncbi:MAG: hypothetical protein AVDCRST_MAG54-3942, partial [uncultured Actinomycetospora sp.]